MSECQETRKQPNTELRDLLKINPAKTHKLSELSKSVQNRLAKLNAMFDELRRGENVLSESRKKNIILMSEKIDAKSVK